MQDELITYETAILAKEKGFDIPTRAYFDGKNSHGNGAAEYTRLNPSLTKRPTQSLLQRWLREIHNIQVDASASTKSYGTSRDFEWVYKCSIWFKNVDNLGAYSTYEGALEAGLQAALKLIKTN